MITRKVKDTFGNEHSVHAWFMLYNGWEFFQLDKEEDGVAFGFMDGCPFPELGYSNLNDIRANCMAQGEGAELWEIAPPIEWEWDFDEVENYA